MRSPRTPSSRRRRESSRASRARVEREPRTRSTGRRSWRGATNAVRRAACGTEDGCVVSRGSRKGTAAPGDTQRHAKRDRLGARGCSARFALQRSARCGDVERHSQAPWHRTQEEGTAYYERAAQHDGRPAVGTHGSARPRASSSRFCRWLPSVRARGAQRYGSHLRARRSGGVRRSQQDRPRTQRTHEDGRVRQRPSHVPGARNEDWLELAGVTEGPLFSPINRHEQLSPKRLTGHAVAVIVKRTASSTGLPTPELSGHSLRAGFVTEAAKNGADYSAIMDQTGHESLTTVHGYNRRKKKWEKPGTRPVDRVSAKRAEVEGGRA